MTNRTDGRLSFQIRFHSHNVFSVAPKFALRFALCVATQPPGEMSEREAASCVTLGPTHYARPFGTTTLHLAVAAPDLPVAVVVASFSQKTC